MSFPEWTAVCADGDVHEGDVIRVEPAGFPPLAVFNVEGVYYVTVDRCTHAEAPLSDGIVYGDIIECPFHGGCFHIPSGRVTARPPKVPLTTFQVRVENGEVMVRAPGSPGQTSPGGTPEDRNEGGPVGSEGGSPA